MSARMNLGFNFIPTGPMPEAIELCKQAESSGFRWLGVVDSQLIARELYVTYAAYLLSTSRARFIPMVSNPLTRHPAVTASAMLSLDELSPGRPSLGLASGDSAVYGIGMTQAKVEYLRDYVQAVKGLLDGQEVVWKGKSFKAEWSGWEPPSAVKVYVAAGGPRTTRMAAQVADGIIFNVGMGATASDVARCIELVREGAGEIGRNPDELELWWHLTVSMADSREAALSGMGHLGVHFLARATMEGKGIPEEYRPALKRLEREHNVTSHAVPSNFGQMAKELGVFEFLVERACALVGTPHDIAESVEMLYGNGIRNLMFLCHSEDKGAVATALGREVLPRFS